MSSPLSPSTFTLAQTLAWSDYLLHHFRSEAHWKKVMCRTVRCEKCRHGPIARWVEVLYGDEEQNVRSVYCSEKCAADDEFERHLHCFNRRVERPLTRPAVPESPAEVYIGTPATPPSVNEPAPEFPTNTITASQCAHTCGCVGAEPGKTRLQFAGRSDSEIVTHCYNVRAHPSCSRECPTWQEDGQNVDDEEKSPIFEYPDSPTATQ